MVSQKGYARQIENALTDSRISKANLAILKRYDSHGKFQQLTLGTRSQRLVTLRQLALFVNKNFKNMSREDIENFFSSLGELQPKTWSTKGAFIKSFFKWLHDSDEYPPNVKWINTTVKNKNQKRAPDARKLTRIPQSIVMPAVWFLTSGKPWKSNIKSLKSRKQTMYYQKNC